MAIPKKTDTNQETGVMELVEEVAKEEEAAASTTVATTAEAHPPGLSLTSFSDSDKFLADLGITDIELDFTSFPIVTLKNELFHTAQHKGFGDSFDMHYIAHRRQWLFKGTLKAEDRKEKDQEELVYSSDGLHDKDGEPIAAYIESWRKRGFTVDRSEYFIVLCEVLNGPLAGEICQIQVSPSSKGVLSGYLKGLAIRKINPLEVVTTVSVGATQGSGTTEFNPFVFKHNKTAEY